MSLDGPQFHTELATTPAQMQAVYDLRREAFLDDTSSTSPGVEDGYDGQPNCRSYLLYSGAGEPVGTIRACIFARKFHWSAIPAFDLFGDEIGRLGRDLALVQSTFFALSSGHRGAALSPKLLLVREVLRTAILTHADYVLTIVRDQALQIGFYRRMGFHPLGSPKRHPLPNRDVVLIGVRTDGFLRAVRGNPKLRMIGDFDEAP